MSTPIAGPPLASPPAPGATRPSHFWWLAVAVLWVLVPVLLVAGALAYNALNRGPFTLTDPNRVHTHGTSFTIWSNVKPSHAQCALVEFDGQPYEMHTVLENLTATVNNQTIYAVATAPNGLLPLTYSLQCVGTGLAAYWTTPPVDTGRVTSLFVFAGGIGVLAVLATIGLPTWQRSNRRKSQRAEYDRMIAMYGPPPGLASMHQPFAPAPRPTAPTHRSESLEPSELPESEPTRPPEWGPPSA